MIRRRRREIDDYIRDFVMMLIFFSSNMYTRDKIACITIDLARTVYICIMMSS